MINVFGLGVVGELVPVPVEPEDVGTFPRVKPLDRKAISSSASNVL